MTQAVIIGYKRTPFQFATKGLLKRVRSDDMVAVLVNALIKDINLNPHAIEDLLLGCAFPEGEQGLNLARLIVLNADLPISVAGATLNRFCGSSMQAIHSAAGAIALGSGDVFICAGVESMSRVPMGGFNPLPNPDLYEKLPSAYTNMGDTAENVAAKYKLPRAVQEQLAVDSHRKAAHAQANGHFKDEIVPLTTRDGVVDQDGCIRAETTLEGLAGLKPAFQLEGGTVTAGTSSPLTDGAAAVIVCSEDYAKKHNHPIMAYIRGCAVAGCDPDYMGIGPVGATNKALARAGITIDDLDIIELNEAFASQALACIQDLKLDPSKINMDGGALALGHPLGASGARITGKAAQLLVRENKRYALSTQCIGGGQGIATILERVA